MELNFRKRFYDVVRILLFLGVLGVLVSAETPTINAAQSEPQWQLGDAPERPENYQPTLRAAAPNAFAPVDTTDRAAVVAHHNSQFISTNPADGWTGNHASCTQGNTSQAFRNAVIQQINYYRKLAGIQDVAENSDATERNRVLAAAMLMSVNNNISHGPTSGTHPTCFATLNALANPGTPVRNFYNSNLSQGVHGPEAITGYMQDPGASNTAVGHRGWILSPTQNEMGTGDIPGSASTSTANALDVFAGTASPNRQVRDQVNGEGIIAWPPVGYVPYQGVFSRWHFMLAGADFSGANVTMKKNPGCPSESNIALTVQNRNGGAGEPKIAWVPTGAGAHVETGGRGTWPAPPADEIYEVTVSGVVVGGATKSFTYNVIVIDPAAAAPGAMTWTGASSTAWDTCGNWSNGRAPLTIDNVIVPDVANDPEISSNAVVGDITIQTGANVTMSGGQLDVYGDWVEQGTGQFTGTGGTVEFKGTSSVSMGANSALPDIDIGDGSSAAAVTLNSDVDIDGNVTIESGASLNGNNTRAPNTIEVSGNWTDNNVGSGFIPGTSTLLMDGAAQAITKTTNGAAFSQDFNGSPGSCSTAMPTNWSSENSGAGFGVTWCGSGGGGFPAANAIVRWSDTPSAWLHYSAGVGLSPGVNYTLLYKYQTANGGTSDVHVYLNSAGATAANMLAGTQIDAKAGVASGAALQQATVNFTVPTAGTYYLGFRMQGSSNFTVLDDIVLSGVGSINVNNLSVGAGTTTIAKDLKVAGNLTTAAGSTMKMDSNALTVEGTVTNNGAIEMVKNATNARAQTDYHIRNAAGAVKYYGIEITPTSAYNGNITVNIRGNQTCSQDQTVADTVKRCFDISPASGSPTTDIKFYYLDSEANGNTSPNVWHKIANVAKTWEAETMNGKQDTGVNRWSAATGIDNYSPFALRDLEPTAVGMNSAETATQLSGLGLTMIVFLLVLISFRLLLGASPRRPD